MSWNHLCPSWPTFYCPLDDQNHWKNKPAFWLNRYKQITSAFLLQIATEFLQLRQVVEITTKLLQLGQLFPITTKQSVQSKILKVAVQWKPIYLK